MNGYKMMINSQLNVFSLVTLFYNEVRSSEVYNF